MSATPDSTLADPEQLIADLQRQLAECKAERDAGLQRETATAEVLQVVNSSPGDLVPVFDAILEKALRLCGAAYGHVFRVEGDLSHAVAARGDPEFVEWLLKQGPVRPTPGGILHRMMQGERVVQIPDSTDTDVYRSGSITREIIDRSGVRTTLGVALRNDRALLGAIFVNRREMHPFSDKEIALLQNFAAQAVIAMENARLITETREALEQQTATAEVLGVINSSPGDLVPVFDAMLERAMRLCGAVYGNLLVFDGQSFSLGSIQGEPALVEYARRRGPFQPKPGSALARIVQGHEIAQVANLLELEDYRSTPEFREHVDLGGYRSLLDVALRKENVLLGVIAIFRRDVGAFSDKQIALLQNFAAQAVIAMENARLITETREALEQQTATAEVLQVINSSPGDLAPVFDAILDKALSVCGAAIGELHTYDGERFATTAIRGETPAYVEARATNPAAGRPGTASRRVLETKRPVHILDMQIEAQNRPAESRALIELSGIRTSLTVPLLRDEALLGFIRVYRREVRPFTDQQIALLENFAAQAVIAMENARLITETREALEQQTATAEVLQVINSSPGDLAPVFDAILEKAHSLCGAAKGALVTYDGAQLRGVATRGLSERYAAMVRQQRDNPPGSPPHRLLSGERIVHIPDVATVGLPIPRAAFELEGIRTVLFVPLRKDGVLLGYITALRQEVCPFSDKQIRLLENFAAQAVIAMENARLLGELRQRTEEVGELNRDLEARVAEQVDELGRVGRLKRFLAPQLAELIVSQGDEKILESHRREIVVVFCDLRGYTAFTETAEPEEVLDFLREYHGALGPLVSQYEGTLDQFSGDGIMVFFNDPVPCPDPAERAVKMAMAMREAAGKLIAGWRRHGSELGFGAGIAQGYATLGQIGFSDRSGYTAIGTVCNLAARLCAEAKDGQILISSRIAEAVEAVARLEDLGNLELKGLRRPVAAFNVVQSTSLAEARPNLTVVSSAPGA